MSRIAKNPVIVPSGVEVKLDGQSISVKGKHGALGLVVNNHVSVVQEDDSLRFAPQGKAKQARALAGTFRSLVNNMVIGVTSGFERKLVLNGVGYRAQSKGKELHLTLGFSHPVVYSLPEGVTAETPSQTEIILKSADKQKLGQAAAEIRRYRPPEPYKGKGVAYSDEIIRRKEAKKK